MSAFLNSMQSSSCEMPGWMNCFPGGSAGKEAACNVGDLGWEDALEKGKAIHSSILAWKIPWTVVHGVAKSWTRLGGHVWM